MNKSIWIGFLAVILFSTQLGAQASTTYEVPKHVATVEGIKEYSLENGLKVLLIPDQTQSNAIINIVYNVGSRHEGYGEKGMAHLLEHMLFKSTKNLGDIKKMLSEKGGNANGTTWYDRTNYYEVFSASDESLRWFLEMEADRMINATILQEDLDKEFSVVRNEFEIGENDPSGVLMERIASTAFLWHNYGNSTIGSKEDIERVKADRLRVFYEKYYQPDNATLIVAGKFDESSALKYISEYFSVIPKPARVLEKTYTVEPPQDGERYVELIRSGDVQFVSALYHTAPYAGKDYAALDALIEILTSDPSGYLYKALIDTQKASSFYAWQPTTRDASFIYFNVEVPKDKSLDEAKSVLLKELDNIHAIEYTEQDLKRAKAKLVKGLENLKNNTIWFASSLTEVIGSGDYRLAFLYRDNIENLTLEDINRVAKKYFKPNNRTYGVFIPGDNQERVKPEEISDEQIVSLTQNYQGREVEEELSDFEATIKNVVANTTTGTLSNGMKYAFLKKPIKGKKVTATFNLLVGDEKILENKSEVTEMLAAMLKAGTKTKTKEQIKDILDETKTNINFGFGSQNLFISLNTYEENLESTFELLKELLTESTFPENELSKNILEYKTYYESYKNEPRNLAQKELQRLSSNYPKGHPYYATSFDEDIEALQKVTRKDIVEFYNTILGANNGVGTVIGNIDAVKVKGLLESTFGSWSSKVNYRKIESKHFNTASQTKKLQTPDKENAAGFAVVNFPIKRDHPDYPALLMADQMLGSGGFLTSRIPTRLRENEGISYGAGSFLNINREFEASSWGIYAFFNPAKVKLVESAIKEEVSKAVKDGFTKEEFTASLTSWNNSRSTSLGNDNFLANLLNTHLLFGTPIEEFDELGKKVEKLGVEEINAVTTKYIKPENLILVLAGDFDKN